MCTPFIDLLGQIRNRFGLLLESQSNQFAQTHAGLFSLHSFLFRHTKGVAYSPSVWLCQ